MTFKGYGTELQGLIYAENRICPAVSERDAWRRNGDPPISFPRRKAKASLPIRAIGDMMVAEILMGEYGNEKRDSHAAGCCGSSRCFR